jgi:hypothetical protein
LGFSSLFLFLILLPIVAVNPAQATAYNYYHVTVQRSASSEPAPQGRFGGTHCAPVLNANRDIYA